MRDSKLWSEGQRCKSISGRELWIDDCCPGAFEQGTIDLGLYYSEMNTTVILDNKSSAYSSLQQILSALTTVRFEVRSCQETALCIWIICLQGGVVTPLDKCRYILQMCNHLFCFLGVDAFD